MHAVGLKHLHPQTCSAGSACAKHDVRWCRYAGALRGAAVFV